MTTIEHNHQEVNGVNVVFFEKKGCILRGIETKWDGPIYRYEECLLLNFVKRMLLNKGVMRGEMDRRVIYASKTFSDEFKKKYEIEEIKKPKVRPKQVRDDGK
jgi:hypothetical protein